MEASSVIHGLIDVSARELTLLCEAGYAYLDLKKPKEAEEIFVGVAALVPKSEVPLICRGNVYLRQRRFERALKFYRDAQKLSPKSALAHTHIGEALLFMGKTTEAKKMLTQAVDLDPESSAADLARALLEGMETPTS